MKPLTIPLFLIIPMLVMFLASGCYRIPATVRDNPDLPFTRIGDYPFHTETYGDPKAPPLLVVHGGPGGDLNYLLPLKNLSDKFHVIFYDQRGTGLSPRTESGIDSIDDYVNDLSNLIHHFADGRKVTLIGHSWGGMLVSRYLNNNPMNVEQAIVIEPGMLTRDAAKDFKSGVQAGQSFWSQVALAPIFLKSAFVKRIDGYEMKDAIMTGIFNSGGGKPFQCEGTQIPPGSYIRSGFRAFEITMKPVFDNPDLFPETIAKTLNDYKGKITLLSSQCSVAGFDFQNRNHIRLFPVGTRHIRLNGTGHNFITTHPVDSLAVIREILIGNPEREYDIKK